MQVLDKIYHFFFFVGVFFLPFNSDIPEWLGFLGEYSADSSPLFFLISFLFFVLAFILGKKINLPINTSIYKAFFLFVLVLIICTLVNIPVIQDNYFKQTSGINRFFRQFISLVLSAIVFCFLFYNICLDMGVKSFFDKTRQVILYSLILVFIVGLLQFVIVNFNITALIPVAYSFDYLPFVDVYLDFRLQRVASISDEPPFLAIYLISIFGFMFSYIFTSKRKYLKYVPVLIVLFLGLVSKSRTAFVVILIQLLIGSYYAYRHSDLFKRIAKRALAVIAVLAIILVSFFYKPLTEKLEDRMQSLDFTRLTYNPKDNSTSNQSRLGTQVALWEVYKEHPVFGTGWGQQAYESRFEYPKWAMKNNYEFQYSFLNKKKTSFPPGFNMYLRILTETGIVGLLSFILFLGLIWKEAKSTYKNKPENLYINIALYIAMVGFFINWLQIDSFRMYSFWIFLAMLLAIKRKNEIKS